MPDLDIFPVLIVERISRSVFHLIWFILGDREKSMSAKDIFPLKQALRLVQLGIQCDYLMNAILSAACAVAVVI